MKFINFLFKNQIDFFIQAIHQDCFFKNYTYFIVIVVVIIINFNQNK